MTVIRQYLLQVFNVEPSLSAAVSQLVNSETVLAEDVRVAQRAVRAGSIRRYDYARAVIAYIEGTTFCLKQASLGLNDALSTPPLTVLERQFCQEQDYTRLRDDVYQREQPSATFTFTSNVLNAFRVAATAFGIRFALDVSGLGWEFLGNLGSLNRHPMHSRMSSQPFDTRKDEMMADGAFRYYQTELARFLALVGSHRTPGTAEGSQSDRDVP